MADPAGVDDRLFIRRTLTGALILIGVAAVLWLIFRLNTVVWMVVVALFVTVAFEPPVHFLAKRGWRRGAATGLVFVVAVLLAGAFVWALAPLFIDQIQSLVDAIPGMFQAVVDFLENTFGFDLSDVDPATAGQDLLTSVQGLAGAIAGGVVGVTASLFGFLFFATTVALFSFYMIADLPKLQRTVLSFMPEEQQRHAIHVWDVAVEKMGAYIYSRLILSVLSGTLTAIYLSILGVPFAVSLGIWVGVLSQFVPVVGTYLAAVLPTIVALTFRDGATAIWVVVFFLAYQQLENYLIAPRITRKTMEIHPAISVAAVTIKNTLLGGIGVILALPMAGIIQAILSESRESYDVILDEPEAAAES